MYRIALPVRVIPFVFSKRTEFLCTSERVLKKIRFLIRYFLFFLWKTNTNYNFFYVAEVLSIRLQMKVI